MSVLPDSEDTLARSGFLRRPNPITTFLAGGGRNDAQCRTFGTDTSDRWRPARAIAIGGLIILIATGASAAMLRDEVPLGDLMCRLQDAGAVAAPSVQVDEIACVYRPAEGGIEEHYTGTLSAVGADDPLKDNKVLTWAVRGPQGLDVRPGVLAQHYRAAPEVSNGGARSLLGDTRTSIVLRESTSPRTSSAIPIAAMQLELQRAIAVGDYWKPSSC